MNKYLNGELVEMTQEEIDEHNAHVEAKQNDFTIDWNILRTTRNDLLTKTDYLMTIDKFNMLTTEKQNELTAYRQALRDLPANTTNPREVTYPTFSIGQ
jgi:hypothetical protein